MVRGGRKMMREGIGEETLGRIERGLVHKGQGEGEKDSDKVPREMANGAR